MKRPLPVKTALTAKEIGENLASWRKMLGLTSQQVAERAAVARTTVSKLENGDSSVSFATFLNVARALGILDAVALSTDPYETDLGRARADQALPQRVRKRR